MAHIYLQENNKVSGQIIMSQSITPKKLCWNCDGNVDMETTECPYCGTDLSSPVAESPEGAVNLAPPFALESESPLPEEEAPVAVKPRPESLEAPSFLDGVLPMGLLIASGIFTIFGFALFLHSDAPTFSLTWKTSQWPVYLLPGLLLGYFGYRHLPSDDI